MTSHPPANMEANPHAGVHSQRYAGPMKTDVAPNGAPPKSPAIRPLRAGEEAEATTVFQEAVLGSWRQPKPPLWVSDDDRHAEHRLATSDLQRMHAENADLVLVAERDGEMVGMAATTIRDDHAHIVFLFVLPEHQGKGVGKALLAETTRAIAAHGAHKISLTASDDRRAWQRYLRMGLLPGAPIVSLSAPEPQIPDAAADGLTQTAVDPADERQLAALDALDHQIKGASRRVDRLAWHAEGAREALVYSEDGADTPVGAYVVSRHHDQCRIGPVVAIAPEHVAPIVRRALVAARDLCRGGAGAVAGGRPGAEPGRCRSAAGGGVSAA